MFKLLDDNVKQLTKEDAASDEDPFIKIGQSVADIIRNSGSRFSIGVYGEWGTGKTINEAISSHLDSFIRDDEILLSWDDLLKRDASEFVKLKEFLDHRFNLSWIKNSNLHFKNDRTVIIVDNKVKNENLLRKKLFSALFFVFKGNRTKMTYKVDTHSISINYDEGRNNATLRVGNHDYTLDATKETGNRISLRLKGPEILTVWFDAWRYEREEYFALIALMKTIAYAMKDVPYYQNVKQVLLRGLGIIGKDVLRHFATQFAMTTEGFLT